MLRRPTRTPRCPTSLRPASSSSARSASPTPPLRNHDARYVFGALDPRTLRPLWERPWPYPDPPSGLAQGSHHVGAWNAGQLVIARFTDGATLGEIAFGEREPLLAASTAPRSIVWVTDAKTRRVRFRALAPRR